MRLRPALMPLGGSLVNLMAIWRRLMENLGWTSVVIHTRKRLLIVSTSRSVISSSSMNSSPK